MRAAVLIAALLLGGCAQRLSQIPPLYGCEGIPEFCPDRAPVDDPEPGPGDLV